MASVIAMGASAANAVVVTLDDFDAPTPAEVGTASLMSTPANIGPTVVGPWTRTGSVSVDSGGGAGTIAINQFPSNLTGSYDFGTTGTITVEWTHMATTDFSLVDKFILSGFDADKEFVFGLAITDSDGTAVGTGSLTEPETMGTVDSNVFISSFSNMGGGDGVFDESSVKSIQLTLGDTTGGLDVALDAIQINVVPIPAAGFLLLGGLGGLMLLRRKA